MANGEKRSSKSNTGEGTEASVADARVFRPRSRARFAPEHRIILDLLIQARKEANLTQRDLAARLGKVHSHVAAVELAERDVTGVELIRWCRATGLTLSEFVARYEAREAELSGG